MPLKQTTGSRAQVMHGNAAKTSGGLTKSQLKYNKQGKIVSKKASALAKRNNRLVKAGFITRKGEFGVSMKGGGRDIYANARRLKPHMDSSIPQSINPRGGVFGDSKVNDISKIRGPHDLFILCEKGKWFTKNKSTILVYAYTRGRDLIQFRISDIPNIDNYIQEQKLKGNNIHKMTCGLKSNQYIIKEASRVLDKLKRKNERKKFNPSKTPSVKKNNFEPNNLDENRNVNLFKTNKSPNLTHTQINEHKQRINNTYQRRLGKTPNPPQ
jgi:hypothetical protein